MSPTRRTLSFDCSSRSATSRWRFSSKFDSFSAIVGELLSTALVDSVRCSAPLLRALAPPPTLLARCSNEEDEDDDVADDECG